MTVVDRIFNLFGYYRLRSDTERQAVESRAAQYTANELLYTGGIYRPRAQGGGLEDVLRTYLNRAENPTLYPIGGHFNPVPEIVDAYQNVLPGTWGDGIGVADRVDDEPVNERLKEPLRQVWRDSNLDTEKQEIIRLTANLGTVGLRVTRTDDGKPFIQAEHPGRIANFEEDARGNVTGVALKYTLPVNRGTLADPDWEDAEVVEVITKDEFSKTVNGEQQIRGEGRRNTLGFCPFVIQRHRRKARSPWGIHAYAGIEAPLHRINWHISRQGVAIDRHLFPKWFGAAGGPRPTSVDFGDGEKFTYVEMKPDTPTPIFQAVVPDIAYDPVQAFWMQLRDLMRGQQPEMNINDVKLLAGISGETIAQVLKPAEAAILRARSLYLHAIQRALQMALSIGSEGGLWDVGGGLGQGSGDRAYRAGLLAFEFEPMPALPPTPYQKVVNADAAVADRKAKFALAAAAPEDISDRERMLLAGYDDARIDEMAEEDDEDGTEDD